MSPHLVPGLGRVVMVIPTYDEALNLPPLVERLRAAQPDVDLLVVDDSSPDGTGAIADEIAAADPQVSVLHRSQQGGPGRGVPARLPGGPGDAATTSSVRWTPTGPTSPSSCTGCSTALREADLVIGSRWVPGGSVVNWPLHRQLLSRGGNFYIRALLGIGVRDATAGFRLFRRTTLELIPLEEIASLGYVFQADLAFRAVRAGLRVVEVPIEFVERERGDSKMSRRIATESFRRITRWGLGERSRQVRAALPGRRRHDAEQPPAPGR